MSGRRKPQNPVIGHIACSDCGEQAAVRQATKRGRHFYTTCSCGTQMGQGAPRQNKIWREAEFSPPQGVTVYKPINVSDDGGALPAPAQAVEPAAEAADSGAAEAAERWRPGDMQADESDGEADGVAAESGGGKKLLTLAVVLAAIGGGVWLS